MNGNLTFAALTAALENLRGKYLVSIDDLLPILRALRQSGSKVYRDPFILPPSAERRKRAIWFVEHNGLVVSELYVDTTRYCPKGMMFDLKAMSVELNPKPELHFDHRNDPLFDDRVIWWRDWSIWGNIWR